MQEKNGYDNEYEFVKYLNRKMVKDVHPLFREIIDYLYPNCSGNDEIKAWKNHYPQKSDIFIRINGVMKGISIKMGSKNSVHVEKITDFINFLIENKVSREVVIEYLKYHYADGTTNGKGSYRQSVLEYKQENHDKIDLINKELNRGDLVLKAIDKFVLKGNNSDYPIDVLILGTVNDFVWASRKDIKKMILSKINNYS